MLCACTCGCSCLLLACVRFSGGPFDLCSKGLSSFVANEIAIQKMKVTDILPASLLTEMAMAITSEPLHLRHPILRGCWSGSQGQWQGYHEEFGSAPGNNASGSTPISQTIAFRKCWMGMLHTHIQI